MLLHLRQLWLGWKVVLGWNQWLLWLVMPAIGWIVAQQAQGQPDGVALRYAHTYAEVVLPLMLVGALFHILTLEREEEMEELVASYPVMLASLALQRVFVNLGLGLVAALLALGPLAAVASVGVLDLLQIMMVPTAFLVGVALTAAMVAGTGVAGLAAAGIWWLVDMITRGAWTGPLFLFPHLVATPTGSAEAAGCASLLLGTGVTLASVAVFLYARTRQR